MKAIPWRKILTSVPVFAVFVGAFCRNYVFSMLITAQPQYFHDAFTMDAAEVSREDLTKGPSEGLVDVDCLFCGSRKLQYFKRQTTVINSSIQIKIRVLIIHPRHTILKVSKRKCINSRFEVVGCQRLQPEETFKKGLSTVDI